MKLIIIVSFLVALNCLNITEVTKKKIVIPKIKTTIPRDCFNIIDGKLKRVPCRIQSPFRTNFIKKKPVIYLYPEEPMDISVELKLKESKFTTVYPKFTKKTPGMFMLKLMELFQLKVKNIHIYSGKLNHMIYQIQMKDLL